MTKASVFSHQARGARRRDFLRRAGGLAGMGLVAGWPVAAWAASDSLLDARFPDLHGVEQPLRQWLGKPIVVNFWATWCPPCVREMPDLEALHQKHPDVQFLGLAVDTAVNVDKFVQKIQVSYPLLLVGHAGIKYMRTLGNRNGGLPFTVVYDARGRLAEKTLGQIKPEHLEKTVRGLLT